MEDDFFLCFYGFQYYLETKSTIVSCGSICFHRASQNAVLNKFVASECESHVGENLHIKLLEERDIPKKTFPLERFTLKRARHFVNVFTKG